MIERDDWGFTDADHADLRALMEIHRDRVEDVLLGLMAKGGLGVIPQPEDPGMMGWLARTLPQNEGRTRVFPKGGIWRALLEELRALENRPGFSTGG